MKFSAEATAVSCDGCGAPIVVTDRGTQCGGEGEGVCPWYCAAEDFDRVYEQPARAAWADAGMDPAEFPDADDRARILASHAEALGPHEPGTPVLVRTERRDASGDEVVERATVVSCSTPAAGEIRLYTVRFPDDTFSVWPAHRVSAAAP